jgi:hypothetical protein
VHELSHRTSELLQQLDSRHTAHTDTLQRLSAAATASVTRHCHGVCSAKRCVPCSNSSSSGSDTGKSDSSDEAVPEHRATASTATAAVPAGHGVRANGGISSGSGARSALHAVCGAIVSPESSPRLSRS